MLVMLMKWVMLLMLLMLLVLILLMASAASHACVHLFLKPRILLISSFPILSICKLSVSIPQIIARHQNRIGQKSFMHVARNDNSAV